MAWHGIHGIRTSVFTSSPAKQINDTFWQSSIAHKFGLSQVPNTICPVSISKMHLLKFPWPNWTSPLPLRHKLAIFCILASILICYQMPNVILSYWKWFNVRPLCVCPCAHVTRTHDVNWRTDSNLFIVFHPTINELLSKMRGRTENRHKKKENEKKN